VTSLPLFIHRALLPALLVLAGLTVGSMAAGTSTPNQSESTGGRPIPRGTTDAPPHSGVAVRSEWRTPPVA